MPSNFKVLKGFSIILILIIVAVLGFAALVVFGPQRIGNFSIPDYGISEPTADSQIKKLNNLSGSDEISAIEKDVDKTFLENLDQGLERLDGDIEQL